MARAADTGWRSAMVTGAPVGLMLATRLNLLWILMTGCRRNIEMTPLCKIEVTHPRVLGSREVRRGGVVDEQAGVQPS